MTPKLLVIAGLIAGHVAADLVVSSLARSSAVPSLLAVTSVFGLALSQACLVSLWFGLSQRSWFGRLGWLAAGSVAIVAYLHQFVELDVGGVFFVVLSGLVVLVTALLARLRGCRIRSIGVAAPFDRRPRLFQFSVAELMGLTTIIAVAIVAISFAASSLGLDSRSAVMLMVWGTSAAATCWGIAWLVLGCARWRWRLLAVPVVLVIALASAATEDAGLGVAVLFGVEAVIIAMTLTPLRLCRYAIAVEDRDTLDGGLV